MLPGEHLPGFKVKGNHLERAVLQIGNISLLQSCLVVWNFFKLLGEECWINNLVGTVYFWCVTFAFCLLIVPCLSLWFPLPPAPWRVSFSHISAVYTALSITMNIFVSEQSVSTVRKGAGWVDCGTLGPAYVWEELKLHGLERCLAMDLPSLLLVWELRALGGFREL